MAIENLMLTLFQATKTAVLVLMVEDKKVREGDESKKGLHL